MAQQWSQPWLPSLAAHVREPGLPLVDHPHNIGSPPNNHVHSRTMVSCPSRPVTFYPSHLGRWRTDQWSLFSFLSFSHSFSSSTRRLVASLAPSISPPVSPLRYGMVGTVAGDGAPRSLSVFRSSGVCWTRPFSLPDSSLVGLRPFLLPLFHPARALCVVFVALCCLLRYWLGFYLN